MTDGLGFPTGRPVALDERVRVWNDASAVLGGAPWGVSHIAPAGRDFIVRVAAAGPRGVVPAPGVESALTDLLLRRGPPAPSWSVIRSTAGPPPPATPACARPTPPSWRSWTPIAQ